MTPERQGIAEYRVRLPLTVPLGGLPYRDVTLLQGAVGWGEISPLPGYPADPALCRQAAVEAATVGWPTPVRQSVEVNAIVPALPPHEAAAIASQGGWRTVKVKVGDADDVDRVAAVRDAVGTTCRIRVDANGAWDVVSAVTAIGRLARYDIELVEQPVASLEEMAAVRKRVKVPLAADESVRTIDDAVTLRRLEAADAVVVKVQPLGGVRAAMKVAEAAGVPAIVSNMYETSIGLAVGLALAAALPELPYACGLGSAGLFHSDVVAEPLVPVDCRLKLRRMEPDSSLLARFAVGRG